MNLAVVVCGIVCYSSFCIYSHRKDLKRTTNETKKKLKYFIENYEEDYFYFKICRCNLLKRCECQYGTNYKTQYFIEYFPEDIKSIRQLSIEYIFSEKEILLRDGLNGLRNASYEDCISENYGCSNFVSKTTSVEQLFDENNKKMYKINVRELRFIHKNGCGLKLRETLLNRKEFYSIETNDEYNINKKLKLFYDEYNKSFYKNTSVYTELFVIERSLKKYEEKLKLMHVAKMFNRDIAYLCKDYL